MARDFEDIDALESMDDDELRARIIEQLEDYGALDTDLIDVDVSDGHVTLTGRVGTEGELQAFEHVITDVLGIQNVSNDIVVDELVRSDYSEAADEAAVQKSMEQGVVGGGADRTTETAEHLLSDTAAEQFGTDDVSEAIERGYSYEPPDQPIQEGTDSRELH